MASCFHLPSRFSDCCFTLPQYFTHLLSLAGPLLLTDVPSSHAQCAEHKHVWKVRLAHLKHVALEHRVASPAVTLSADFFTGRSPVVTIPTDTLPSKT